MKAFTVALIASLSSSGSPVTVTAGPNPITVSGNFVLFPTLTTSPVTAYAHGGLSPYSYEINYVSGDMDITANLFTDSASFEATAVAAPSEYNATFCFKVTDSIGAIGYSPNVDVTITFTS
jgi:hypothetical protein